MFSSCSSLLLSKRKYNEGVYVSSQLFQKKITNSKKKIATIEKQKEAVPESLDVPDEEKIIASDNKFDLRNIIFPKPVIGLKKEFQKQKKIVEDAKKMLEKGGVGDDDPETNVKKTIDEDAVRTLVTGVFSLLLTVCSYKKLAIFTTNVHTKNESLFNHKTVIRSTKPPIFCRCCYLLSVRLFVKRVKCFKSKVLFFFPMVHPPCI